MRSPRLLNVNVRRETGAERKIEMKPWVAALFTFAFAGACIPGALGSQDSLVRLACRLAIVVFVLAALLSLWIPAVRLRIVASALAYLMFASFVTLVVATLVLGGGALNGRVEEDAYYLNSHGRETRVGKWTYYSVAAVETLVFAVWPTGMLLGLRAGLVQRS